MDAFACHTAYLIHSSRVAWLVGTLKLNCAGSGWGTSCGSRVTVRRSSPTFNWAVNSHYHPFTSVEDFWPKKYLKFPCLINELGGFQTPESEHVAVQLPGKCFNSWETANHFLPSSKQRETVSSKIRNFLERAAGISTLVRSKKNI